MHKLERHRKIITLLSEKNFVTVKELKILLSPIQDVTLYRDLIELQDQKLLKYIRGAIETPRNDSPIIPSIDVLKWNDLEIEKNVKIIEDLILKEDDIYLNYSKVALKLVSNFNKNSSTWFETNSLNIAKASEINPSCNLTLIGGYLKKHSSTLVGEVSLKHLANRKYTKCFISVAGYDENFIYLNSESEKMILSKVIHNSGELYIISTKSAKNQIKKQNLLIPDNFKGFIIDGVLL